MQCTVMIVRPRLPSGASKLNQQVRHDIRCGRWRLAEEALSPHWHCMERVTERGGRVSQSKRNRWLGECEPHTVRRRQGGGERVSE